jgi:6-phosphogluconolactonase (cycloisomerase 2 family)
VGFRRSRIGGGDRSGLDDFVQSAGHEITNPGYSVFNGGFDFGDLINDEIPGWERHGGGGNGQINNNSNPYLELDYGIKDYYRTHNPLYFSQTVRELTYDLSVVTTSTTDTFQVYVGGVPVGSGVPLTEESSGFTIHPKVDVSSFAGTVNTLKLQIDSTDSFYPKVRVDNVVLLSGPVADAGGPYSARLGTTIELDASASYDLDGTITEYEWDLDGDGSFETIGQKVDFQTSVDGEYTVQLRVTDSDGYRSDEVQSTINVSPGGVESGDGLIPKKDSYISQSQPEKNFGASQILKGSGTDAAALIYFGFKDKVPSNSFIAEATLKLSFTTVANRLELQIIKSSWKEDEVNYESKIEFGSETVTRYCAGENILCEFDVTPLLKEAMDTNRYHGIYIETPTNYEFVVNSKDGQSTKVPRLVIKHAIRPEAHSGLKPSITLGAKTADIQVIYTDDHGVDASDIGTGDIKVEGPSFNTVATFISKTPAGDAKRIVATYRIEAPNQEQGWTSENNGSYSVTLLAKEVSDTEFFDNYVREANDHLPGSDFTIDLPPIPDNPTNLRTPGISSAQIDLRWDDNSAEETGFRIERKSGSDDFSYLKNLAADTETYADKSLAAGTEYTYRIRAYHNDAGPSGWSSEVAATTMFSDTPFVVAIDQSSISELDGTSTATVTRDVTNGDVIITLAASGDEVTPVPATVTIKDGETSASFRVDAVDDSLLDGTQADSITASASGYNSGSDNIEVTDYEELALTFDEHEIPEYLGTATATVTRTDSGEKLEVTLVNGDDTEVSIPATLTLEINELTGTFEIEAIHDREKDGTQQVTLTAKASGYVDAQSSIDVLNSDDAQILGIVWNDVDKNGIKDENEAGIGCWWVWAEQDGDASRESTELQTLTKTDGTYSILDVPKGRYDVQAELPDGFESTNLVRIKSDDVTVEQKNDVGISTAAGLAISQNRQHLYVTDRSGPESSVHFFSRDDSTGRLTHKAKYRFRDITGENTSYGTNDVAISPDGGHVYAVNSDDSSIFLFDRHQITGELQFKKTFVGRDAPADIYLTADGRHLISANYGKNELRVFSRTSDPNSDEYGDISHIQSLKAGTGAHGASSVTGSPDNDKYIYATSGTNNLFVVLEWKDDDTLEIFQTFQHNNSPSNPGDVNGLQNPRTVAVSPDGRDIYVGTGGGHNVIWFRRNEETDKLSLQQVYKPGEAKLEQVTSVVVSPGGNHVFATGRDSKTIAVFRRDLLSGALDYKYSLDNAATGLVKPGFIVVSGDNQHVYVTDYTSGKNVVVLERDVAPGGAQSVTVHPDLTTTNIDRGIYSESGSFPPAVDAPSSLIVTAISSSKISLAWTDNSDNETGFGIIRQIESSSDWITVTTTDEDVEGFVDSGLQPDTEYTYQIIATDGTCESSASDADSATTLVLPPAAPMNLIATDITTTTVDLEWQDKSDNESGFEVYRKLNSSSQWSLIETASANLLVHADKELSPATSFDYRVRAINAGGESGWTTVLEVRTLLPPPDPPKNLEAVARSSSRIDLEWEDKSNNEEGFEVQYKKGSSDEWAKLGSGTTTTGAGDHVYSHTGLTAETTYFYQVRAVHGDGESPWTDIASATTPAIPPNTKPNAPVDLSPSDNATNIGLTPTLSASKFVDPDNDTHKATQWRIATDRNFENVVLDHQDTDSKKTEQQVPSDTLSYSTNYYWAVIYLDSRNAWGAWSAIHEFATVEELPPTLDSIGNWSLPEDAGRLTIGLTGITTGSNSNSPLRVTATSSNTNLMADPTVTYVSAESTGTIKLQSLKDQHGKSTITVTVEDGGLDGKLNTSVDNASSSRTFDVTVTPVNDKPIAQPITHRPTENSPFEKNKANGLETVSSDVDNDPLTFSLASPPDHGQLVFNEDGSYRYIPHTNFNRTDSFSYRAHDGQLASDTATVTLQIDTIYVWYNGKERKDVDDNGYVTAGDALQIIEVINNTGIRELSKTRDEGVVKPFLDVNRDNYLAPHDVLWVVDFLNQQAAAGAEEGEGESKGAALVIDQLMRNSTSRNHRPERMNLTAATITNLLTQPALDNTPYWQQVDETFSRLGRRGSSFDTAQTDDEQLDWWEFLDEEMTDAID